MNDSNLTNETDPSMCSWFDQAINTGLDNDPYESICGTQPITDDQTQDQEEEN